MENELRVDQHQNEVEKKMNEEIKAIEISDEEDPQGTYGEQKIMKQEEDQRKEFEDSDQTMEYILRADKEKFRSISDLNEDKYRHLMQCMCWRMNLSRATEAMREIGVCRKERNNVGLALQMMEENPMVFRFALEMTLQKVNEEEVRRDRGESVESRWSFRRNLRTTSSIENDLEDEQEPN